MKALITGINGFVGPHLLAELTRHGYEVGGTFIGPRPNLADCAELFEADLRDAEALHRAIGTFRPDFVFHLAGLSDVKSSFGARSLYMDVNAGGAERLLEAVERANPDCGLLMVGSSHEYGVPERSPIDENHPLRPNSPYAESKLASERLALSRADRMKMVVTRSFNHTGAGQPANFVLSNFASQIAGIERGGREPVVQVGNQEAVRDFLSVKDVVAAYRMLGEEGRNGEAYNVCRGSGCSIGDLLTRMIAMSEKAIDVVRDESRLRPHDAPALIGDRSKLSAHTGWEPLVSLDDMLADLLADWRERL